MFKVHPMISKRMFAVATGKTDDFGPKSHTDQFDYHISEILETASPVEKKWASKVAREILGPGGDVIFVGWGGYVLKKQK